MSTFERGKSFEQKVAKMTRLKADKFAKRNAGSHANWHRNSDIFTGLPFHIEAKDHETLKPKEWFRQADDASMNKTPVVAFQMDNEVMCMLRYDDFLNLLVEIADQKLEIADLREPVISQNHEIKVVFPDTDMVTTEPESKKLWGHDFVLCKNGHICTEGKITCMTKGCQYSSTYIKPKAKKDGK